MMDVLDWIGDVLNVYEPHTAFNDLNTGHIVHNNTKPFWPEPLRCKALARPRDNTRS